MAEASGVAGGARRAGDRRPRAVIVGAGFAGLSAAKGLAGSRADVLLLDRNNYHLFFPLLYQVATAGLSPDQVAYPVRAALRHARNVRFRRGEVTGVDLDGRTLSIAGRDAEPYDILILAIGSADNFFGLRGAEEHAVGMKGLPQAIAIRNRVLAAFEQANWERNPRRRDALMTIAVIGGGPTGVEMAGALVELLRHAIRKDCPELDLSRARVVLIEALDRLLTSFPPSLGQNALETLRAMGVEVRLGAPVEDVTPRGVRLKDGEEIETGTLIWAAGIKGADLADPIRVAKGRGGRIPVLPTLQLSGRPEVFVLGDAALLDGPDGQPYPMLASVAMQQGRAAAANALRLLEGRPLLPFRFKDWGTMATIGRSRAVAVLFGRVRLTGWLAWFSWLAVHLVRLISYRNRFLVLVNWIHNYFTYERGVRLILGPAEPAPAAQDGEPAPESHSGSPTDVEKGPRSL